MNIEPVINIIDGKKYIDNVCVEDIINQESVPAIIFNEKRLISLSKYLDNTLKKYYPNTEIHYAIKACYTPDVLKIFLKNDIRLEVMSELEYKIAKSVGARSEELILNGPGKTDKLLELAIKDDIEYINIDCEEELNVISKIAQKYKKNVKVGLRIQPDVPEDSFLKRGEKLGVDVKTGQAERIIKDFENAEFIEICGIQFHSFINQKTHENIVNALKHVIDFIKDMNKKYNFKPEYIDIGGGLATIDNWSKDGIEIFAELTSKEIFKLDWTPKLILEPGRFLVSDCAIAIAKIIRKKINGSQKWLVVNANTNMLIPLASADFKVEDLRCDNENLVQYNIGDCLCSASGTIERDVLLSDNICSGDYLIIKNVGSYTINLSEPFAEPIMPIMLVKNDRIKKIHKGVNIEEILKYFLEG